MLTMIIIIWAIGFILTFLWLLTSVLLSGRSISRQAELLGYGVLGCFIWPVTMFCYIFCFNRSKNKPL